MLFEIQAPSLKHSPKRTRWLGARDRKTFCLVFALFPWFIVSARCCCVSCHLQKKLVDLATNFWRYSIQKAIFTILRFPNKRYENSWSRWCWPRRTRRWPRASHGRATRWDSMWKWILDVRFNDHQTLWIEFMLSTLDFIDVSEAHVDAGATFAPLLRPHSTRITFFVKNVCVAKH